MTTTNFPKSPYPSTATDIFRMEICYRGDSFHGWQIQPEDVTVQSKVQDALRTLYGVPIHAQGASRTDAGVHAMGQTVSYHEPEGIRRTPFVVQRAMKALLPEPISCMRVERVHGVDGKGLPFHARHCARGKRYRYDIWPWRPRPVFGAGTVWQPRASVPEGGWDRARAAAQTLVGAHDFAAFRAKDCAAATTERTMFRVDIVEPTEPGQPVSVYVEGSAFLKYMVRIIAGTLVDIARGTLPVNTFELAYQTGDRRVLGQTAPPYGLTLLEIFYPRFPWRCERFETAANR